MKNQIVAAAAVIGTLAMGATSVSAQSEPDAEITLFHAIPGVDVDVFVDDELVISDFSPGESEDLSDFAGDVIQNLEVRVADSDDVVIGPIDEFAVPSTRDWTVVAGHDENGVPSLTPFENDVSPTADGEGRLTVRHVAAVPAVDVVLDGDALIKDAANKASASIDVPAGEIAGAQLVFPTGEPSIDVPTVEVVAGENLVVYGAGSLDDFVFFTQVDEVGTAAPADEQPAAAVTSDEDADPAAGAEPATDAAPTDDGATTQQTSSDGTPAPTAVHTGDALPSSSAPVPMAIALGLFAAAGALMLSGRRSGTA